MKIGLMLLCAGALLGQIFDAASIKPAAPMECGRIMVGMKGGPGSDDPGTMERFTQFSLSNLIQYAYDLKDYQLQGPDWMQSARFDVQAKFQRRYERAGPGDDAEFAWGEVQARGASFFERGIDLCASGSKGRAEAEGIGRARSQCWELMRLRWTFRPLRAAGKDGMPQMPFGARRGTVGMMMTPGGRARVIANGVTIEKFIEPLGCSWTGLLWI